MASIIYSNPNLGASVPDATKAKLKEKAQEFEAFYIYQFMELMKPKMENTIMHGGAGEDMFRHHLNEELAKNVAKGGGFGLSNAVYAELLRKQEQSQGLPSQ